jgi:hypothetical protein
VYLATGSWLGNETVAKNVGRESALPQKRKRSPEKESDTLIVGDLVEELEKERTCADERKKENRRLRQKLERYEERMDRMMTPLAERKGSAANQE